MRRTVVLLVMLSVVFGVAGLAQGAAPQKAPASEKVLSRDTRGVPTWVQGEIGSLEQGDRQAAAVDFLKTFAHQTLNAVGTEEFRVNRILEDDLGQVHFRAQQYLRGLPVVGAELLVHTDARSGEVFIVNGHFARDENVGREPRTSSDVALKQASLEAGIHNGEVLDKPQLTYILAADDRAHLAWSALVRYESEGEQVDRLFADAISGKLLARHPQIQPIKDRRTYNANNTTTLPGTLVISEGGSSSDVVAQAAHDNAGRVYDYYWTVFVRDSLNAAGLQIRSTVRYYPPNGDVNNAVWDKTRQQIWYGNGDGSTMIPLGQALDVVAHELTHGVTQFESNLTYSGESGALNESLSDVFGAAVEAWADGAVSADTWKIGEDIYTPGIADDALRYMNNPTTDGYSYDYYPERYTGTNDNGGVHWNSGISNLAFYLLSQGGSHPRGKTSNVVPGIGITKAADIFYRAQTTYLTSSDNFQAMRNATASAAASVYGSNSLEYYAVQEAWCAVGVYGCPAKAYATISGPYDACTPQYVTVTASAASTRAGCSASSCTYDWSYRWCENDGVPNPCPSTYYSTNNYTNSETKDMRSYDKYLDFKVVEVCQVQCWGNTSSETLTTTRQVWGPQSGDCGGGGGPL
jgi:vibriolysin